MQARKPNVDLAALESEERRICLAPSSNGEEARRRVWRVFKESNLKYRRTRPYQWWTFPGDHPLDSFRAHKALASEGVGRGSCKPTIEFRYLRPHVIFLMHKRALIRRIGHFLCRGLAKKIVDRWHKFWHDSVSPGSQLSVSNELDLLP